nr:pre-peptidase C-terminal domain-containing protein [Coralloluteibacterium stylophorae]
MRNPDAPVQLAHYTDDCAAPSDVVLEPARDRAYVACDQGVQVLDVSDPAQPVRVAAVPGEPWSGGRLALQDGLLWFADAAGLGAWDVRAEGAPVAVAHADLGGDAPVRLRVLADGRLAVPTGQAGLHLFAAPALPETPAIPLENGVLVRDLAGAAGDELLYRVDLPAGATRLRVLTAGGSGDVGLSIRRGAAPTDTEYDARSTRPGNNETVTVDAPAAGTWYVRVHGEKAFARLSLRASWTTP